MADAFSLAFRRFSLPSSRDPEVVSVESYKPSRDIHPTRRTAGRECASAPTRPSHTTRPDCTGQEVLELAR